MERDRRVGSVGQDTSVELSVRHTVPVDDKIHQTSCQGFDRRQRYILVIKEYHQTIHIASLDEYIPVGIFFSVQPYKEHTTIDCQIRCDPSYLLQYWPIVPCL